MYHQNLLRSLFLDHFIRNADILDFVLFCLPRVKDRRSPTMHASGFTQRTSVSLKDQSTTLKFGETPFANVLRISIIQGLYDFGS